MSLSDDCITIKNIFYYSLLKNYSFNIYTNAVAVSLKPGDVSGGPVPVQAVMM